MELFTVAVRSRISAVRVAVGFAALLGVFVNESLRHQRAVVDPDLRDWLGGFTGSSVAAMTARAALTLKLK